MVTSDDRPTRPLSLGGQSGESAGDLLRHRYGLGILRGDRQVECRSLGMGVEVGLGFVPRLEALPGVGVTAASGPLLAHLARDPEPYAQPVAAAGELVKVCDAADMDHRHLTGLGHRRHRARVDSVDMGL
ncbi:hypothetical protein [Microtetraspora malaysiensis]|uniref:Uncharacterized protein n=1 Tax=Microtetraspora malaysiensis TaxID=161358 RepID=A0ABW6T143_9ACTN